MISLLYEGEDGVTGELMNYDGKVYRIATSIGPITIPASDVTCIGNACPESRRLEPVLPSILLTGIDGTVSVRGNLIDITNGEYVLATEFGEFRIAVDTVTCEGEGCPADKETLPETGLVVLSDGSNVVEGMLVGFDNASFVLQHDLLGTLRVDRTEFDCKGEVCP